MLASFFFSSYIARVRIRARASPPRTSSSCTGSRFFVAGITSRFHSISLLNGRSTGISLPRVPSPARNFLIKRIEMPRAVHFPGGEEREEEWGLEDSAEKFARIFRYSSRRDTFEFIYRVQKRGKHAASRVVRVIANTDKHS